MITQELQDISAVSRKIYGDYAYATGYFQSTVAQMYSLLSKKDQKYFKETLAKQVGKLVDEIE